MPKSKNKRNAAAAERDVAVDATGVPIGDGTEDRYWKWGFYMNPNDPALMIPKRDGLGYTLNLAHRGGWLIFAVILGVALASGFLHF